MCAYRSVDTLNPHSAINEFLVFAATIGVREPLLVNVLGDRPNVFSFSPVSAGSFKDLFSACS